MPSVEIVRDVDGIAHVRAEDVDGAFFGQGHAAVHDRLWQMEYDRRRASGRFAEIIGAPGLASDRFHRRLAIAASARADYDALSAAARAACESYAAGVNAALGALSSEQLPPELTALGVTPEPWEPWDSVAVFKIRHLLMGTYEVKLWRSGLVRNLGADLAAKLWPTEEEITVVPGPALRVARDLGRDLTPLAEALAQIPEDAAASNNLAVHGSRTASGFPIVAGDPHRALDLPNVYWQNHVTCPEFDVIGFSFPGVPGFPHFAHNAQVAWSITHGMADDQDVYLERLRSRDDVVEYEHDGEWRVAATRVETFMVAGGAPQQADVIETHHGPVVAGGPELGVGLAVRWTALVERDTTFEAMVRMLSVRTIGELDDAMRDWVAPANNLLMGDRHGDIAYRYRGRLAVRAAANGWTIVPGWLSEHDWRGWAEYDDQPHVVNPAEGYLVTANNRPAGEGPYVSNDFGHPCRARRITELVAAGDGWTGDGVLEVLGDTHSLVAARFVDGLLRVEGTHPVERAAQDVLRAWDGDLGFDSPGATIYSACRGELLRIVAVCIGMSRDRLGAISAGPTLYQTARFVWTRLAYLAGARDDELLAGIGGWDAAYASALRWGVRSLEARFGADPKRWRWGTVHTVRWQHALHALRPDLVDALPMPEAVEVAGDGDCPRATGVAPPGLEAVAGPVARYVFDVGDWDASQWIVPHGVSGDSRSPHWDDQLERWATLKMLPMRYSREVVDAAAASREVIERA